MLIDALTVAVLVFFLYRIATALRTTLSAPSARRRWLDIVGGLRIRHFVPVPFVLTAVMALAGVLLAVPGLDFGWWTAIGGLGNPVTGASARTQGTPLEWIIPLVFLTLLIPVLPLFAEREELMFRAGNEHDSWPRRAWRCIQFGLVHAIVGIPIGVALALSVAGAYFTAWYLVAYRRAAERSPDPLAPAGVLTLTRTRSDPQARHAAVLESTRAHVAYNLLIVTAVLAWIVAWLLFG